MAPAFVSFSRNSQIVRASGTRLADDALVPSDVVLPGDDATIDDVRELLGDEGLVPGM